MIPAEATAGADDLVEFLQGFRVHEPVERLKVDFEGCVIETIGFIMVSTTTLKALSV